MGRGGTSIKTVSYIVHMSSNSYVFSVQGICGSFSEERSTGMKMGQFTERGRFVFEAGGSSHRQQSPRISSASSIIGLPEHYVVDYSYELLVSRGFLEKCPFVKHSIAVAVTISFQ